MIIIYLSKFIGNKILLLSATFAYDHQIHIEPNYNYICKVHGLTSLKSLYLVVNVLIHNPDTPLIYIYMFRH